MKKSALVNVVAIFAALLAAYPLEWLLLLGKSPHLWGDVKLFAIDNLAILFLATIAFSATRGTRRPKEPLSAKAAFLLAALTIIIAAIQQRIFPVNLDFFLAGCFPATAFLAGAVLANEWKKAFPILAGFFAIILLVYSFLTDNFVGFPGNWNWNYTLTALMLPALCSWFWRGRKLIVISAAAIIFFIAIGVVKNPETLPKGTLISLAGATVLIWAIAKIPEKLRFKVIAALFVVGMIAFFLFVNFFGKEINDYRIQLWRGSCQLVLQHPFSGCGNARFEGLIPDFLPENYHFVKFRAERHTHPHNEALFMFTSFGIAGVLFLLVAMINALKIDHDKCFNTKYMQWLVAVLFIHGMVDVLLGEVHSGTLFYLTLGALNNLPPDDDPDTVPEKQFVATPITARIAGTILLVCFLILAARSFVGTRLCLEAKLDFRNSQRALPLLLAAEKIKATPEITYLLGVDFFRTGKLTEATENFAEIESKFGWGGYIHSNGLAARACAAQKNYPLAAEYFAKEQRRFPFSIVNTYYQLKMLETISPDAAKSYMLDFDNLLQRRGVDRSILPEIMRHQSLDDLLPVNMDSETSINGK